MARSKGQVNSDFGQIWDDLKSKPLLEIVGTSSLSTVGTLLNVSNPVTKGWEALAETLGYSRVEVESLRHEGNKLYQKTSGVLLLEGWGGRGSGSTLQVLEQALLHLDRLDVLEELQKAAKDECTLSVTFYMDGEERSMTVPGVWGMSTLRQALGGALEEIGLATDDFEIQGSESRDISWTTQARECKGIHLRLVKKALPQPKFDVTNVMKAPPTIYLPKLPSVDENAEKPGRNNRSGSKKASTVSGPVPTNARARPALPGVQRSQSERSALNPKYPPTSSVPPTINIFASTGANINIALADATSLLGGKSVNRQLKEAKATTPRVSSAQNSKENVLPTQQSENSTERSGLSSGTIRKEVCVGVPVRDTTEQTPLLSEDDKAGTSAEPYDQDQNGLKASGDSLAPRKPKLPPKKTKPTTVTAPQVSQQEEGCLEHTLHCQGGVYPSPLEAPQQRAPAPPTSVPVMSEMPCGNCHDRMGSVSDDVFWEEVAKVPGFHPNIPDDNVAIHTFMFNYLRDEGWYVIRKCENNKLAVSVTYLGEIRHYRIGHADGRFYFRKDEFQASSLHELIETYKWNDLPAKCDRNGLAQNPASSPPVPVRERGVRLLKPV